LFGTLTVEFVITGYRTTYHRLLTIARTNTRPHGHSPAPASTRTGNSPYEVMNYDLLPPGKTQNRTIARARIGTLTCCLHSVLWT